MLFGALGRQLAWGLPAVIRELRRWRSLALLIPDAALRRDALSALDHKRGNTNGAALFWILPRARNRNLLRLLVTYQVMWDFLDCVSESGALYGAENGLRMHQALVDALDPSRSPADYFAFHASRDDGGYLRMLVEACRQCCHALPSFQHVHPVLLREARRANVQAINHDLDPAARAAGLRNWVAHEYPARYDVSWFELAAAAGAGLAIYALFALASEPRCTLIDIDRAYRMYFPWASALATMLDSFVDQIDDRRKGDHCYLSYYETDERATQSIERLMQRCLLESRALENSEGHILIVACMVAMYLSRDSARSPLLRQRTRRIMRAGGSLTRALLPVLRIWRIAYRQTSS